VVQVELAQLGLRTSFERLIVAELGDDTWQGVRSKYWSFPLYFLPVVTHRRCSAKEGEEAAAAEAAGTS
jgi:hypothetical protein